MSALAMPPAHPSPDPPPARPLFIEARDAASDAGAGVVFDAGFGGAGLDGDGSGGAMDAGASLEGGSSGGPPIAGADRVMAGLRPRFRNCYKLGVATDPKMQGRANLATSVSAKGDVVSVTVTQVDKMNPRVVSCVVAVMQKARFTAPGGAGSSLQVPIAFR